MCGVLVCPSLRLQPLAAGDADLHCAGRVSRGAETAVPLVWSDSIRQLKVLQLTGLVEWLCWDALGTAARASGAALHAACRTVGEDDVWAAARGPASSIRAKKICQHRPRHRNHTDQALTRSVQATSMHHIQLHTPREYQ